MENAIILLQCADQHGIISKISDFVFRYNGNILQFDQYSTDNENGQYFMRLDFCFHPEHVSKEHIKNEFSIIAKSLKASWDIHYRHIKRKMGILVSKYDHCLFELLYRWQSGELNVDIPFVISNHEDLRPVVEQYSIPYYYVKNSKEIREESEDKLLHYVKDHSDFLVLARYMQILSNSFLKSYNKDVMNIHHSFLPSFKGANPYKQAFERGVKVIGATAHYVTGDLDEGPIIEQVVERVSHRDNVDNLKRKGKNIEKTALANAVLAHIEHRVIKFRNRTVVFY